MPQVQVDVISRTSDHSLPCLSYRLTADMPHTIYLAHRDFIWMLIESADSLLPSVFRIRYFMLEPENNVGVRHFIAIA